MQHIFLIGAKSLGAYGGYETFINKLTEYHENNKNLKYHVAVKANGQGAYVPDGVEVVNNRFMYHNADCFQITVPEKLGAAQAIYYDCAALKKSIEIIKKEKIEKAIVYVMTCRIGPFFNHYAKQIRNLGGRIFLNPDGHEWMRAKWSAPVRKYWKYSEKRMVLGSDVIVCDSKNIEKYIRKTYKVENTIFIAYGADLAHSKLSDDDEKIMNWYRENGLKKKEYYLVVGRFVPENSFEVMIREFMISKSNKDFALITNVDDTFLSKLEEKLHFMSDKRIKFVGTVYDQELLKKIRENAYGYFHGHTVGGTNPSLIEALGSTDLNLLVDVSFNKEVADNSALYWGKKEGELAKLINEADCMEDEEIQKLGEMARKRVSEHYTWEKICSMYETVFRRE